MGSDEDIFLQEYFVYCKKKWQNQSTFYPEDAAGVLCGIAQGLMLKVIETSAIMTRKK